MQLTVNNTKRFLKLKPLSVRLKEETKLSGFSAAPVKNEGSAIAFDNAQEAFSARYNHETIALGFSLTEEAIEDNLYDSLSSRYTKALARAMAYTKQTKAAAILNNGFSTAFPGGDGEPLFSTAHPLVSGGVNSNEPSTPADLNETSLEAAVIQIAAWTDERGLLIAAKPRKLIVPLHFNLSLLVFLRQSFVLVQQTTTSTLSRTTVRFQKVTGLTTT
jgi:hypothetical protein